MGRPRRGGSPTCTPKQTRKHRSRPTPRWLSKTTDLDEVARRRCLMVLAVLSGERAVTDVIAEAQISRGLYYQLETKALNAMLRALSPGAEADSSTEAMGAARRIEELEAKVKRLEQDKRRAERLLFLTRKVIRPGPVTTGLGRPRKSETARRSGAAGRRPSPGSPASRTRASRPQPEATSPSPSPSTPTQAGASAP